MQSYKHTTLCHKSEDQNPKKGTEVQHKIMIIYNFLAYEITEILHYFRWLFSSLLVLQEPCPARKKLHFLL
jgi:hypothetical protein